MQIKQGFLWRCLVLPVHSTDRFPPRLSMGEPAQVFHGKSAGGHLQQVSECALSIPQAESLPL